MKNKKNSKSLELNKKSISELNRKEIKGGLAASGSDFVCGSDLCNLTKEDPCKAKESPAQILKEPSNSFATKRTKN